MLEDKESGLYKVSFRVKNESNTVDLYNEDNVLIYKNTNYFNIQHIN